MKYYKLKNSFSIKEIGSFSQADNINKLGDLEFVGIKGRKAPLNFKWDIPEPIMQKKAKSTTYLDVIPFSKTLFLVFKKYFIDFLTDFNVAHFNHWPLKVHHKNEILTDYELFHLSYPSNGASIINFKESNFIVLPRGGWDQATIKKSVKLENFESYCNLKEVLNESEDDLTISYTKLVLDFRNTVEDLIRFIDLPFYNGYYVSERLKKAIEEKRFTGMIFQEIEKTDKRINLIY